MIIYRPGIDFIPLKIDDITVWITPLTQEQKSQIIALMTLADGQKEADIIAQGSMAMRYSIKDIEGIKTLDGKKYKLRFRKDGTLTDECVAELVNMTHGEKALVACYQLMLNPSKVKVQGVEVDLKGSKVVKKK